MNALIFKDAASSAFISASDPRAEHIEKVLKPKDGDEIFAGIANGPLFKAKIFKEANGYRLSAERTELPNPPPLAADIYVSFARPQIAKRILFEAACFGVKSLSFYPASKGEADYAKSSLYANKEYEEHLIRGAEQACATHVPKFAILSSLQEAVDKCGKDSIKLAPDLYEAAIRFSEMRAKSGHFSIIFGSERGFSNPDRNLLRENGFALASLGRRALRTDTAIISVLSLLSA